MKARIFIFVIVIFSSKILIGQIESNYLPSEIKYTISTRIGINSLNQLNIQFEKPLSNKIGVRTNIGFNYGPKYLIGEGPFCAAELLLTATNKIGIIAKIGIVLFKNANYYNKTWSILLDYRRSSINDLVVDEGCFSGSNGALIEIYDWKANDLGLILYRDFIRHTKKISNIYFGVGTSLRFEEKEYSIIRTGSMPSESDLIENNNKFILRFDLGIRMKLTKIKAQ